ncbi:HAD family phosphatase [candidate division KSB1 bacterium]|nr:HAD family phosphatase [candidate division KSB1 bacterium]
MGRIKIQTDFRKGINLINACILDMDGVIVDTEPIHIESFRYLLKERNVQYTEEFIFSFVGHSIEDNIKQINQTYLKGNEINIQEGVKRRNELYLHLLSTQSINPLPGVIELIQHCKNNQILLGLASSSDWVQINAVMKRVLGNDYHNTFDAIVSGDDVSQKKPAPDIYQKIINLLNVLPETCIAFEDSQAGVDSAKKAGIICVALRNIYTSDSKLEKADRIINSLTEPLKNNFWGF